MSRPLRIDYPNAWHHVMNRARRGTALFIDKADFQQFIDLILETAKLFNVNVAAYCLMPTHYYLVQTPDANLSCCMRHLNGVYTQKYNVVHGSDGTFDAWQQRVYCLGQRSFFQKENRYGNPASKGLAPDLDRIISEVNRYYEARPAALTAVRRGIENEPRDVAIYLIRTMRSEPLMRIGARFGLNRYSSVSSVVIRVNTKLQKDRKFKERLAHIENIILKGQT